MNYTYELLEKKLQPLAEEIRSQLAVIELDMEELRTHKQKLTALLKVLDPEPQKRNGKVPMANVSDESVTKLYNFLHDNRERLNEEGFYAKGLVADPELHSPKNISTISRSLLVLHQRDLITLVGRGRGGKRIYKVV